MRVTSISVKVWRLVTLHPQVATISLYVPICHLHYGGSTFVT